MIRFVAWFLSAFCSGALLAERLGDSTCVWVCLALVSIGALLGICPIRRITWIDRFSRLDLRRASAVATVLAFIAAAGILLGALQNFSSSSGRVLADAELSSVAAYSGATLVTGFVDGPVKESAKSFSMPFSIAGSYARSGFVRWVRGVDVWLTISKGSHALSSMGAKVFALYFYDRAKKIASGDALALYIRAKRVPSGNFLNSLMRRGIHWEASGSMYGVNRLSGVGVGPFVWQGRMLGAIEDRVTKGLGPEMAGLILAVSMGDRALVASPVVSALASLGIVHAFVASGATIRMTVEPAVRAIRKRLSSWPEVWYTFGLAGTAFLLLLTGFAPPAFRAAVAYGYELTALCLNRRADRLTANTLAAAALTVWQPTLLVDPGVVLSFCSVATLQYLPDALGSLAPLRRMGGRLRSIMARGLAAEVGITPLVAVLYGQFNVASLAVNLFLYPILEWLLPASLLFLAVAYLDPALCIAVQAPLAGAASSVSSSLLWAAKQPIVLKFRPLSYVDVLMYYGAVILTVETIKRFGSGRLRSYW